MSTATLLISTNMRRSSSSNPWRRLKTPPVLLRRQEAVGFKFKPWKTEVLTVCPASRRSTTAIGDGESASDKTRKKVLQFVLWAAEGAYIIWLFLLPYAPGDPVWAISSDTINSLVGLSLNFFFILPLMNSVGIHLLEAPVLHPMSEGLFNFVIGWTFMFGPLLFTDHNRDRYKGSLGVLWGFQMFLTNTFLIPYMAIRLNNNNKEEEEYKARGIVESVMVNGAPLVALIGGAASFVSIVWALFGRPDFGGLPDRLDFLVTYLGSERLAYAFIWDICLYSLFQPWLIGDNLQNVMETKVSLVNYLRFVPVLGLLAYLLCLDQEPV